MKRRSQSIYLQLLTDKHAPEHYRYTHFTSRVWVIITGVSPVISLFCRVLIVLYVCYCLSAGWSAACLSSRSSAVCFTVPEVRPCTPSTSAPSGDLRPLNVSSRPRDPSCSHITIQSRHVWCLQHLIRNQPALVMCHISTDLSFEMFIFIFWCGVCMDCVWVVCVCERDAALYRRHVDVLIWRVLSEKFGVF